MAVIESPTPAEIRATREAAGLTQHQAADLLYVSLNTLQKWEYGERTMHPAFYELLRIKISMLRAE